jgi:hypothetical protein
MIRIVVDDEAARLLLLAYLKTAMGQALLRRGRSGSVIDHLTVADVEAVPVPIFPEDLAASVVRSMQDAITSRERGRAMLGAVLAEMEERLPSSQESGWTWWSKRAAKCRDRLDAAHHSPAVANDREQVLHAGGMALETLATAVLPIRYKRYYVEAKHGRPIVSGRQLL